MNEHYFTENPESEIKEKYFTASIRNRSLHFTSVSGVFSFEDKIDRVSQLLIENFKPTGHSVLDLGCGYGVIGLFLKAFYIEQDVTMADINSRAVDYTRLNAKRNNLSVEVLKSDLYSSLENIKFDDIVSNPPFAAGKKLNTRLIQEAFEHLYPKGALWLVAFHNKGGSTLKDIMRSSFGNVEDIEKSGGMRVYKSIRMD